MKPRIYRNPEELILEICERINDVDAATVAQIYNAINPEAHAEAIDEEHISLNDLDG